MAAYLVRHASAGVRGLSDPQDLQRPLDEFGKAQARAIADALSDHSPVRLLSSAAVRCSQTLAPLGAVTGLTVEHHDALMEGSRPVDVVELLRDLTAAGGDVVLCSHGDVIPPAIETLLGEGMVLIGGRGCEKGSIWELEARGRDYVAGRYRAAADVSRDLAAS